MFNGWRTVEACVYLFYLKVIHYNEETFFNDMEVVLRKRKGSVEICPQKVCLKRRRLLDYKRTLLITYSVIPCLWYCYEFFYVSSFFIGIFSKKENYYHVPALTIAMSYLRAIFSESVLLYVSYFAGKSTTFVQNKLEDMVTKIIEQNENDKWQDCLSQVEKEKSFCYTAWNTFPINQSFIFTFASSLISYAILCFQLLSGTNSDNIQQTCQTVQCICNHTLRDIQIDVNHFKILFYIFFL